MQVAVARRAQQRFDLRPEQPVAVQPAADLGRPGRIIVGVGIAGAHSDHRPVGVLQPVAQVGKLHILGQVVQNHRLGAQQPGAGRALRQRVGRVRGRVDGRQQAERRAVFGQAGQRGHGVGRAPVQAGDGDLAVRLRHVHAGRLHRQRRGVPARGVQNGAVPGGLGRHAVAQLHHCRDAHAARHDGGVAHRAVLVAGQAQDHAAVQTEQVAGEKPVRHQNAGPLQVQAAARAAVQNIHHAAADVLHVDAALTDILVVDVAQPPGKNLPGALHRGGAAGPGGYVIADLVGKGLVLQQRDLEQQNVGVRAFGALAQAAQLVLGQHHGHVIQRALAERVAHDAVQPGGAMVDLLHRADHDALGSRHTGKRIHRQTSCSEVTAKGSRPAHG